MRVPKPDDIPEFGYDADLDLLDKKEKKKAKKALRKHTKAMCELKLAVASNIISSIIEETKVLKRFPFGRLWLVLAAMYRMYRGISMLDHVQLDKDKLMIKMTNDKHSDKLFEQMYAVKKQYVHRTNVAPTISQLIACAFNGVSQDYTLDFTAKLLSMRGEIDHYKIIEKLKESRKRVTHLIAQEQEQGQGQ